MLKGQFTFQPALRALQQPHKHSATQLEHHYIQ